MGKYYFLYVRVSLLEMLSNQSKFMNKLEINVEQFENGDLIRFAVMNNETKF